MKKILIAGSGSFIGNAVKARLDAFEGQYCCDCISLRGDEWRKTDFSQYDAVVHVAGIAHVSPKKALIPEYKRINCDLTLECADLARRAGAKQFIFLSSMIIYGSASRAGRRRMIDADTPPKPDGAYGQSKLDAENGLRAMECGDFRVAILRPPMVYGRGCRGNYVMLQKWVGRIPFFPDFPGHRSVIYVENLAELIRRIIDRGDRGIFCPQDAQLASACMLAQEIAAARGAKLKPVRLFNPLIRLFGGVSILRRAFGDMQYAPELSLYPEEYRIFSLSSAIRKTENGQA